MWATWIAIGVIALIIAGAVIMIARYKKKGVQCIGCPYAHKCAGSAKASCPSSNRPVDIESH